MKLKFFLLSFAIWLVPFIIRLSVHIEPSVNENHEANTNIVVENILKSIDEHNADTTFALIFKNNMKSCLINILAGVLFSVGTVVNLLINGFASANVFRSVYDLGFPLTSILKTTLPHSFELIGFWLSGTVGFMITWQVVRFMRGKEAFSANIIKQIGVLVLIIVVLILGAAYVEANISVNIIQ